MKKKSCRGITCRLDYIKISYGKTGELR